MLLEGRDDMITEEDWRLAGIMRKISDSTRQSVIDTLARTRAQENRARGHAEADRAIVVDQRRDQAVMQRAGQSIMRRLSQNTRWVAHNTLRRFLNVKVRDYFEDAIASLIETGQVEERASRADHKGHQGLEYRRAQ
jgi:hypothetical protein